MEDKTIKALSSLDLAPGASLEDVKRSYRELALIWHPDKVPDQVKDRATNKFMIINEAYQWLIDHVQENLAKLADAIDRWVIAGLLVRGTHGTTELAARVLRLARTGNLQTYAFWFAAGMAALLIFTLG